MAIVAVLSFVLAVGVTAGVEGCKRDSAKAGAPVTNVPPYPVPVPPNGVIPPSWSQAAWFIDPQNTTGCANDLNATCGSSTCTSGIGPVGDGPCATFAQVAGRWGTYAPRLQQTTTITFLSSQPPTGDPVIIRAQMENGAAVNVTGAPIGTATRVCSGTLGTVTAKSRTTNQTLTSTFTLTATDGGTCTLAPGLLVQNTTHPASAFLIENSGSTWTLSQPIGAPGEVDTWASADAVTINRLTGVSVVDFSPQQVGTPLAANPMTAGMVSNVTVLASGLSDGGTYVDVLQVGPQAAMQFVAAQRMIVTFPEQSTAGGMQGALFAVDMMGGVANSNGIAAGAAVASLRLVAGGAIGGTANTCQQATAQGWLLDGDEFIGVCTSGVSPAVNLTNSSLGQVYVDTSATLNFAGQGSMLSVTAINSVATVYGPGTLNLAYDADLVYPGGNDGGRVSFPIASLKANNQTSMCRQAPSKPVGYDTCQIGLSGPSLDSYLGLDAGSGCLTTGAAAFCNFGP
jgi:hypothetical protein